METVFEKEVRLCKLSWNGLHMESLLNGGKMPDTLRWRYLVQDR